MKIAGAGTQHLTHARYRSQEKQNERDWRFFEVALKDGSLRITKPASTKPLDLRGQVVVTANGMQILGDTAEVLA